MVVISETMAHRFFPDENPIGKPIVIWSRDAKPARVVGVVGDVRQFGLNELALPSLYFPAAQISSADRIFAVRTARDPMLLSSAMRAAVHETDRELPVNALSAVEQIVSDSLAQRRLAMLLMCVFAAIAFVLAAIGIYGVVAYAVTQATQEIGVRLALGAQRGHILRLVLGYGSLMMAAGLTIGCAAALATGRLLESQRATGCGWIAGLRTPSLASPASGPTCGFAVRID